VDLGLTTEQQDLQQSARRFVREEVTTDRIVAESRHDVGFDRATWTKMADLGWLAMAIPEDRGGVGASPTDVAVLFEEFGRGPLPGPLFETGVLVPSVLLALGDAPVAGELLSAIASGEAVVAFAPASAANVPSARNVSSVELRDGALLGRAMFVREVAGSTHVLAIARSVTAPSGWACVIADTAGVTITNLAGHAPRMFAVDFGGVSVAPERCIDLSEEGLAAVADAILSSLPVSCAYQVGSAQAVYEMTVQYSRDRVQFGKPIGTFQRVQGHIIDLANGLDSARWTTYFALSKIGNGASLPREAVHVAKVATAEGHYSACTSSHEVHAGIGSDLQYGLAVHTFASRLLYSYLGDPGWHRRQLARTLGFGSRR
jgi:alkylation response protein AidB-like acyl-CoA dehydrogenase